VRRGLDVPLAELTAANTLPSSAPTTATINGPRVAWAPYAGSASSG